MANEITKLTFNIPTKEFQKIKAIAALENDTVTNIIRSAFSRYVYLWGEQKNGSKVLLEDNSGEVFKIKWK